MSNENQVEEQTLTVPDEQTAAPEMQETQIDTSKLFSKAYNEGKTKAEKDLLVKIRSLGIEDAETLEDGITRLSQVLAPKKESKNEVEELRKMLEEANIKAETARNEYEAYIHEVKLDATMNDALGSLTAEGSLTLKPEHLKNLFYLEYDIEQEGNSFFVTKDGIPVLDNHGNRKAVGDVLKSFAKENRYLSPKVMGAGGGTGDSSASSDRPSRSEFRNLLQSKSPEAQQKAAELFALSKKVGWAD